MLLRVILLRTSQVRVMEVRPNSVAVMPSSMMSPWREALTKLISEMYLVTTRWLPNWTMA
ncbi:Uncharacterised protein [Mycobacterium tuberculosis]|nr:Uncharacterised protein [Mycobacterium tuberculosis]